MRPNYSLAPPTQIGRKSWKPTATYSIFPPTAPAVRPYLPAAGATCHLLEGVGHAVGADLGSMANKASDALLIAILDPNQAVDNRFLAYLAVTKDGRIHNGVLAAETGNSITLREQDGKEEVILRTDLDELQGTGKSLMPEGLEKDLSRQDLADVIAYVRAVGDAAGGAEAVNASEDAERSSTHPLWVKVGVRIPHKPAWSCASCLISLTVMTAILGGLFFSIPYLEYSGIALCGSSC